MKKIYPFAVVLLSAMIVAIIIHSKPKENGQNETVNYVENEDQISEIVNTNIVVEPDAKHIESKENIMVNSTNAVSTTIRFSQLDLRWEDDEETYSGNLRAYEKQFKEKRAKRLAGIAKSATPEEWAKIERARRTPSGAASPTYANNYMIEQLTKSYKNKSLSRSAADVIFEEHGPANIGGRTRGLLIDPRDESGNTWIAGSSTGGVWKTTDAGASWVDLTSNLPNMGTNTLAFSAVNPDIIYLGTGEHFTRDIDGSGLFKTMDGGQTWTQIANPDDFPDFKNVSRIIVDPNDPNTVLAATSSSLWNPPGILRQYAIYKSTDGGENWRRTYSSVQGAVDDLDHFHDNIHTIYASINGRGIAKSEDAGESWELIPITVQSEDGGFYQRVELAVSPLDPSRLWASIEPGYLLYSNDAGRTWIQAVTTDASGESLLFLGGQGFYDNIITPHPFDTNSVYVGGVNAFMFTVDPEGVTTVTTRDFAFQPEDEFENYIRDVGIIFAIGNIPDYEIRFGVDSQYAYVFDAINFGNGNDYLGFKKVPFQIWDLNADQQLSFAFLDCNLDGDFDIFNPESMAYDTNSMCPVEPIVITARPYTGMIDSFLTVGPNYAIMPITLIGMSGATPDAELNFDSIPELILQYKQQEVGFTASATTHISDAYDEFTGVNNFGLNNFANGKGLHPDQHNIVAQITDFASQELRLIIANDGGVYVSEPSTTPGVQEGSFTARTRGYVTTQFYGADKAPGEDRFVGGMQDNGTWFSSRSMDDTEQNIYEFAIGGDGFEALWNQRNPDWIIGSSQFNDFETTRDGGETWQRATNFQIRSSGPFVSRLSGHVSNPEKVHAIGSVGVWISENFGNDWELSPIQSDKWRFSSSADIEVALSDPDVIWVGSFHDANFSIQVSSDGGQSFTSTAHYEEVNLGIVSGLGTHPYNADKAYALFSFQGLPKVLETTDRGASWVDISGYADDSTGLSSRGFPDVATNCLFVFPNDTSRMWVGTEIGIVETMDNGMSWQLLTDGIGATNISNMVLRDDKIVISTYGRGVWTARVDGLEANEIVFIPLIRSVAIDLDNRNYEADILFSNAFDSSFIYLNDTIVDVLNKHDSMSYLYTIEDGTINNGTNTVLVISYLDGEEYRSVEAQFETEEILSSVRTYFNEFDVLERDDEFTYEGLFVGTSPLDSGRAIQSEHPYLRDLNTMALLRHPLIVEDQVISYRDIAIVEPGSEGTEFGDDEFWDFVIIEASTNNVDWTPLKAYDARFDSTWMEVFDQSATPDSSMFREHSIAIGDFFDEGEIILLRFRLFSDPEAVGWGWIVDDLSIAPADTTTVSVGEQLQTDDYHMYPNPVRDELFVELDGEDIRNVSLYDLNGRLIQSINPSDRRERISIFTNELPSGTYIVRLISATGGIGSKKIIVH